jgi:hypothetical protein
MIEKTLSGLFKVVSEEAATNAAFASKLEGSLAKFAEDFQASRRVEAAVGDFHPFIEFKKGTPEEFKARLAKFGAPELRLIVKNHGLDAAGELPAKAAKKALVEHVFTAAQKRAERDRKLFEY